MEWIKTPPIYVRSLQFDADGIRSPTAVACDKRFRVRAMALLL